MDMLMNLVIALVLLLVAVTAALLGREHAIVRYYARQATRPTTAAGIDASDSTDAVPVDVEHQAPADSSPRTAAAGGVR